MKRSSELRRVVPLSHLDDQAPISVDGLPLTAVASPSTVEELSETLRSLFENRISVLIVGNGSRLHIGNPPSRAALVLSTLDLRGIIEFDGEEGVIKVLAGTPIVSN